MIPILFIITFLWGTTFIFSKVLVADLSPAFIVMMRFLISLIMFVVLFAKKIKFSKSIIKAGAAIGAVNGLALVLQVVGLKYTSASNSAFITAVYIIFVPIIEWIFWKRDRILM